MNVKPIRSQIGERSFRTRQRKRTLAHVGEQKNAAAVIGPLEPGLEIYLMITGQFHAINVVEAVLDQMSEPADVDISSWTIAHFELGRLAYFLDSGNAKRIRFITDRSFKGRHPDILSSLIASIGQENIRMLECHAKFVTIQNDQWHIVIRTSANLNSNRRVENYELSDDASLARYMTAFVDEIFSHEKPIGKREMRLLKTIGEGNPHEKSRNDGTSDKLSDFIKDDLDDLNNLLSGFE